MFTNKRNLKFRGLVQLALALLIAKVLAEILYEYRWYFPADFVASAFLVGRQDTFEGLYRLAFYLHIIAGPPCIAMAVYLVASSTTKSKAGHRVLGRIFVPLVLLVIVPTGLVMASAAHAGPIAGAGFATLSILTGYCAAKTMETAWRRRWQAHQIWAKRTAIVILSPLILRVTSGVFSVLNLESQTLYCLNAWMSWIVPLAIFEICRRSANLGRVAMRPPVAIN